MKTIITRCGDGTKIVLTGDPGQIDNPYVDSASNGLTIVADRFKREKLAAHIVLSQGRAQRARRARRQPAVNADAWVSSADRALALACERSS